MCRLELVAAGETSGSGEAESGSDGNKDVQAYGFGQSSSNEGSGSNGSSEADKHLPNDEADARRRKKDNLNAREMITRSYVEQQQQQQQHKQQKQQMQNQKQKLKHSDDDVPSAAGRGGCGSSFGTAGSDTTENTDSNSLSCISSFLASAGSCSRSSSQRTSPSRSPQSQQSASPPMQNSSRSSPENARAANGDGNVGSECTADGGQDDASKADVSSGSNDSGIAMAKKQPYKKRYRDVSPNDSMADKSAYFSKSPRSAEGATFLAEAANPASSANSTRPKLEQNNEDFQHS
jgi:hypothetical protein